MRYFQRYKINADFGVIGWGRHGEVDIAPETLYALAGGNRKSARVAEGRAPYGKSKGKLTH